MARRRRAAKSPRRRTPSTPPEAHVNTVEGYFGLLKRGVMGTYHHWSYQHLHRYLSEFDFRYNARKTTDVERAEIAIRERRQAAHDGAIKRARAS